MLHICARWLDNVCSISKMKTWRLVIANLTKESEDWQGKVYYVAKKVLPNIVWVFAIFLFSIHVGLICICMGVASHHILKAKIGATLNFGDKNSNHVTKQLNHVTKQPHITPSTTWLYIDNGFCNLKLFSGTDQSHPRWSTSPRWSKSPLRRVFFCFFFTLEPCIRARVRTAMPAWEIA